MTKDDRTLRPLDQRGATLFDDTRRGVTEPVASVDKILADVQTACDIFVLKVRKALDGRRGA